MREYRYRVDADGRIFHDGSEVVDACWYEPRAALAAQRDGELFLVFPTIKHLEQLSQFASADDVLRHARDHQCGCRRRVTSRSACVACVGH